MMIKKIYCPDSERKEAILKVLKKYGQIFQTKVYHLSSVPYYLCTQLLKELEEEGKVKCIKVDKFTFWKIAGEKI